MQAIQLDLLQTMGLAGIVLLVGYWLKNNVKWINKITIPAAVIGGLLFALLNTVFYQLGMGYILIDDTLNSFFMVFYFTTIGLGASLSNSRGLGSYIMKLLGLTVVAIFAQNLLAVGIGGVFGVEAPISLMMGSAALVGGPGTVAAVGPSVVSLGEAFSAATTAGMTAATVGISIGGILAGPTGTRLIKKNSLSADISEQEAAAIALEKEDEESQMIERGSVFKAILTIFALMFFGSFVTDAINSFMGIFVDGISFPVVLGPMFLGFLLRLFSDRQGKGLVTAEGVDLVADISLDIFLALTIINLQFWTIFDIALPMVIILVAEIVLTLAMAYYVIFPAMGKTYDAAVTSAGFVGFACGTTSNAMSGMREVTGQFGPSPKSILATSIVCGVFLDFVNVMLIYATLGIFV